MATIATMTEDFEGGTVDGDITTGNSNASGTFGTAPTFSDDFAITGTQSMHVNPSASVSYAQFDSTNQSEIRFDLYYYFTDLLSVDGAIANWLNSTTKIGDLRIQSGTFQLRDNNSGRWNSTHTVTTGQWYRLSVRCTPGSATGHQVRLFYGANLYGTTPDEDSGGQTATQSSQSTINRVRIGSIASDTCNYYVDHLVADDTNWPDPAQQQQNQAPVAEAGADQLDVEPYAEITLDGSGSTDPDGTIAAYTWSQTEGPAVTLTGSGATRTFTAPPTMAGTELEFQLVVTDDETEASEPDVCTVTVLPHNRWVVAPDGTTRVPVRRYVVTA